jgi:hypothetical protein
MPYSLKIRLRAARIRLFKRFRSVAFLKRFFPTTAKIAFSPFALFLILIEKRGKFLQAESLFLPLLRLRASTRLPLPLLERFKKPWDLFLFFLFG